MKSSDSRHPDISTPRHVILGVIPARWGSTRFPGKSLAPIAGKPLIQRVIERCRKAKSLDGILVATDDERIRDAVIALDVDVVMTRADHPSGTDRIAEAIQGREADVVVNIQGDEPLIDPLLIDQVGSTLAETDKWDMATAATAITDEADITNSSVVKVVWDRDGRALYFSRATIPFIREKDTGPARDEPLYWRHIGIYGYRRSFLERLVAEPPCALEEAEKLEQLRALYLGCRMKVIPTEEIGIGVDTPEDVAKVEAVIERES